MNQTSESKEKAYLVDGKYTLTDLVDIDRLRRILEDFSAATGFTTGLVSYPDQQILVATGWRDICTRFHRAYPESARYCKESNLFLTERLEKHSELNIKPCENGLVDGATPIIIKGKHVASLTTGQVLFQEPDIERFMRQAEAFGYDTDGYLEALRRTPVVTEDQLKKALSFLSGIAIMIAEQGLNNLRIKETALDLANEMAVRHRVEEDLRASERRYRELIQNIPVGLYRNTPGKNGRFIMANPAIARMFGYDTVDEFLQVPVAALYTDPLEREAFSRKLVTGSRVFSEELRLNRKDGTGIWGMVTAQVVRGDGGEIQYFDGMIEDITDLKQAQEERRKLEFQVQQAQKMEAVGTLASGIAHDFNNILQAISGYLQVMEKNLPADQPNLIEYITGADRVVDRAAGLISRLLTFGRRGPSEFCPVNLNKIVELAVMILEYTVPKMIHIETILAEDLWLIHGDPNQQEQIVVNLGANAKDAMPEGGRLIFETQNIALDEAYCRTCLDVPPGQYVHLRVTDTGGGMDRETVKHIFEPFFTTKGVGHGTGLGLSTVYGIVRGHGGHITCYSEPNRGTVFNIYLPALPAEFQDSTTRPETVDEIVGGNETILLVDDESTILEIASDTLRDNGYTILTAENGHEALKIFQSSGGCVNLVILDLGMPGIGGIDCLRELIRLDPKIKVIIASGYSMDGPVSEALNSGAKAFISKPYRLRDFLKKVRTVLDS